MRLGFITPVLGARGRGEVFTFAAFGRLIEALRDQVDDFELGLSVAPDRERVHDHAVRIDDGRIHFTALPYMPSIARGQLVARGCRAAIERIESNVDAAIIQLPFSAPTALVPNAGPRVYHVCADVSGVVRASKFYRGPRRALAVGAAYAMDGFQAALFRQPDVRIVTNGRALYDHYARRPGTAVVSSTMRDAEVGSARRSRPVGDPFRILFIGYLRPEKGLDVLLAAYRALVAHDPTIELHIIGSRDAAEGGAEAELLRDIDALRGKYPVSLLGHRAFGPALFQAYADADVVVVPSRSEGTPRVLVEARAFRCPVIGTAVGGIPTSINDGVDGLLVPRENARALAEAIERLRTDAALRARVIDAGLTRARATTVEAFARNLVEQARLAARLPPRTVSAEPRLDYGRKVA